MLSTFSGGQKFGNFDYLDADLAIPNTVIHQLESLDSVSLVDERLILETEIEEGKNFTMIEDGQTRSVGGNRKGESLIIGLNPEKTVGPLSFKGKFLVNTSEFEAVIGDSIATKMYSPDASKGIFYSDPLVQSGMMYNKTFTITGVCVDPINNGLVTYLPLKTLRNLTGSSPNIVLVTPKDNVDKAEFIEQLRQTVGAIDSDLQVFPLDWITQKNLNYLGATWAVIMLVPLVTLVSAAMCLVGYSILSVDEQHQEFAILRAVGTKPRIIVDILSIQGLILLLSSFGVGIAFGTMTTLMILMTNPLVTSLTIVGIAAWLLSALTAMFLLSLYPAIKMSKTPLLKILS